MGAEFTRLMFLQINFPALGKINLLTQALFSLLRWPERESLVGAVPRCILGGICAGKQLIIGTPPPFAVFVRNYRIKGKKFLRFHFDTGRVF